MSMIIAVLKHREEVASMAVLPGSVLASILSMVENTADRNRISQVCRGFRFYERQSRCSLTVRAPRQQLGLVPLCFSGVTDLDLSALTLFPHEVRAFNFNTCHKLRLARAFPNVRTLKAMTVSDDSVREIGDIWPQIENLNLTQQRDLENPPRLKTLLETFSRCEVLDARNVQCDSLTVDLSGVQSLALKTVNLETVIITSDEEISILAEKCSGLETLCISIHPCRMSGECFLTLASRCRKLTRLKLFFCLDSVRQFNLVKARKTLIYLARMTSELPDIEIDISFQQLPSVVTGYRMECLSGMAANIRSLVLYSTDAEMQGICCCINLTELTFGACEGVGDNDLVAVAKKCPKLVTLRILDCRRVTDRGLKILAQILKLRSISLCFLRIPVKAQVDAIKPMAGSLSAIRLMVNGPVDSFSSLKGWPHLSRLEITLSSNVPQRVLMEPWLVSCPKLKHVGLVTQHWCPSTLGFLAMSPSLPSLSLSFSKHVSKDLVRLFLEDIALLDQLSTLTLYISNKEWLSEEAGEIFGKCPRLKSLNIIWIADAVSPGDHRFNIRPFLLQLLGIKCLQDVQLPSFLADEVDMKIFYRGLHAHTVHSILRSMSALRTRGGPSRAKSRGIMHVRELIVGDA